MAAAAAPAGMLSRAQLLRFATPDETAAEFFARQVSEAVPTGVAPIDAHVKLRPGQVLELAGPTGTGKSELLAEVRPRCFAPPLHLHRCTCAVALAPLHSRHCSAAPPPLLYFAPLQPAPANPPDRGALCHEPAWRRPLGGARCGAGAITAGSLLFVLPARMLCAR